MPEHSTELGIARLPYNDRQRIIVVPDDVLEAYDGGADSAPGSWSADGIRSRLPALGRRSVPTTVPHQSLRAIEALERQGVRILPVARTEASELGWAAGHPLDGLVYVGDPAMPSSYYQLSDFHVRVFEAKFAEAIRLLGYLGATNFVVRSEEGGGGKCAGKMTIPVQASPGTGKGAGRGSATRKVNVEAERRPVAAGERRERDWKEGETSGRGV